MTARKSITPCIFGTTIGFEIQTLTRVRLNVDDLVFSISRSDVELSKRDPCIKIFRKKVKSEIFTWIGLYWKAFEIGLRREGGFYGAGLWLEGITVNSRDAIQVLSDLAKQVEALAITNGEFEKPLLSILDRMQIPSNLVPLNESSKTYLRGGLNPGAIPSAFIGKLELIGKLEQGTVREMVDWAQNDGLAQKFRALIIAPELSFPKGASSTLERYNDLSDVVRKLESDLSVRIARLEADKLALQRHLETLENDLRVAQRDAQRSSQEAKDWKERHDKILQSFRKNQNQGDSSSFSKADYLKLSFLIFVFVILCFIVWNRFERSPQVNPNSGWQLPRGDLIPDVSSDHQTEEKQPTSEIPQLDDLSDNSQPLDDSEDTQQPPLRSAGPPFDRPRQ